MNTLDFTYLLENPDAITPEQTSALNEVVKEYPYFQAARALYLKGLKNQDSFLYNNQLKKTAAYTQDRTVLFDYITSENFNQTAISEQIKAQEQQLRDMQVHDIIDVSADLDAEELEKANQVLSSDFFIRKDQPQETEDIDAVQTAEEKLQVGKPLEFTKSETHSFTQWLKITSFDKIDRTESSSDPVEESNLPEELISETKPSTLVSFTESDEDNEDPDRTRRLELIDKFIESNPKIKVRTPEEGFKKQDLQSDFQPNESLMTETLARVYVEQKNYQKAKQAYKILCLKYPEKSGFFADQIRAIVKLQENK
ncbi:hypothetical protein [Leeuwenhoekiella sp. NPDC079379]|uniref:hypothetical protein n=1 Tax=Leeuwenhoekiella sp. NPDC079379 TaxID=3364122 RepID=UPI0037C6A764